MPVESSTNLQERREHAHQRAAGDEARGDQRALLVARRGQRRRPSRSAAGARRRRPRAPAASSAPWAGTSPGRRRGRRRRTSPPRPRRRRRCRRGTRGRPRRPSRRAARRPWRWAAAPAAGGGAAGDGREAVDVGHQEDDGRGGDRGRHRAHEVARSRSAAAWRRASRRSCTGSPASRVIESAVQTTPPISSTCSIPLSPREAQGREHDGGDDERGQRHARDRRDRDHRDRPGRDGGEEERDDAG